MRILQDIVVPKAHDAKSSGFEPCGAFAIGSDCEPMLSAIHFDDQPPRGAKNVDDIGPKGHLLSETQTLELFAAKPLPQRALGVRSILSQSPGVRRSHAIRVWRRRCRIKIEQPPTLTRPH